VAPRFDGRPNDQATRSNLLSRRGGAYRKVRGLSTVTSHPSSRWNRLAEIPAIRFLKFGVDSCPLRARNKGADRGGEGARGSVRLGLYLRERIQGSAWAVIPYQLPKLTGCGVTQGVRCGLWPTDCRAGSQEHNDHAAPAFHDDLDLRVWLTPVRTESAMLPKPAGTDESRPVSFTQVKGTGTL
jgi:hypothetical protein